MGAASGFLIFFKAARRCIVDVRRVDASRHMMQSTPMTAMAKRRQECRSNSRQLFREQRCAVAKMVPYYFAKACR